MRAFLERGGELGFVAAEGRAHHLLVRRGATRERKRESERREGTDLCCRRALHLLSPRQIAVDGRPVCCPLPAVYAQGASDSVRDFTKVYTARRGAQKKRALAGPFHLLVV